jgi:hypothetical protein
LRFRTAGQDKDKISTEQGCTLGAVYFPLLAILLPKWLAKIDVTHGNNCHKTILLISGQGTPRDENARTRDNSTELTAMIMKLFIEKKYPGITVKLIHSPQTNLFRYDENIFFVKKELLPCIDVIRNNMAKQYGAKWKDLLYVTLSFADGSSARVSAISAALRPYK